MNWKGNTEQLPASPFYLETETKVSNAQKVAVSGNLFRNWQLIELPETEIAQSEEALPLKKQVGNSHTQDLTKDKEGSKKSISFIPDVALMKAVATIDKVTDDLSIKPKIQNQQVNWIEKWDETTYSKIGIETERREFEQNDTLFDQVLPLDTVHSQANATNDMKESKFLRWLKDKEAKRQGYQTQKAEGKSKEVTEKEELKKDKATQEAKPEKKLSKKKKKKELKKILKKSLKMEDEIVSETLANVMVQQGHIGKAIEMYEKLSLIFPEKSSYFAGIIGKLEEE